MGTDPSTRYAYPLGFLGRTAGFSLAACAVGLALLQWLFSHELGGSFAPAFYVLKNLLAFLVPILVFCAVAVLVVASVAVFVVALLASHKIAGPLFRLQRVGGYIERKILIGRIHLRAGDQGKPLASGLNTWMQLRKERVERLKSLAEQLDKGLHELENSAYKGDKEALRKALSVLHALGRSLIESNS